MNALIKWELRQRRTAILWWSLGTIGLIAMLLLIYPSIHDQAAQLNKALEQLPDSLKALKTGGTNIDITSPIGYLHSQIFYITLPLVWIILTVTRGSALLGKEEESKTLELLLARPISRGKLLTAKALSGIVELLIVSIAALAGLLLFTKVVGLDISAGALAITTAYTALFCLSFGMISFTLTAIGRLTKRASTAIAVAVAFGGYMVASLSSVSHYLTNITKIVPYNYFSPENILAGHYSTGLTYYLVGVTLFALLGSYFGFRRRDIS